MGVDLDVEERAKRNRERMPGTADIVDHWRSRFGQACVVRYALEGELEVGRRVTSDPARTMNASQWLHYVKTGEVPVGKERPA